MESVWAGACQSSARNGYARQTTEATLPPSPLLALVGCRAWPFPHKTPETPVLGRLSEQAPDLGIASGPQAVPARLGATYVAARLGKGKDRWEGRQSIIVSPGEALAAPSSFWIPGL